MGKSACPETWEYATIVASCWLLVASCYLLVAGLTSNEQPAPSTNKRLILKH